jgi:hypothetical protein
MERKDFDIAEGLVDRMDKLEKTIFDLQEIMNKKSYVICANNDYYSHKPGTCGVQSYSSLEPAQHCVELNEGEIATVVFVQDILEYYINTLNLELNELRKTFDEI